MSYIFDIRRETVWSPALLVGTIYVAYVRALEQIFSSPAGFIPVSRDMVDIDEKVFATFVESLIEENLNTRHEIKRLELQAVISPGIVMLERARFTLDDLVPSHVLSEARKYERSMPI